MAHGDRDKTYETLCNASASGLDAAIKAKMLDANVDSVTFRVIGFCHDGTNYCALCVYNKK